MIDGEGILVAEDSEDDRFFLKRAMVKAGLIERTTFVSNGRELIRCLSTRISDVPPSEGSLPKLILLDLVMPGLTGLSALEWIKRQNELREIPVVVFTGTENPIYLTRAVALGVARCCAKDPDPSKWVDMVRDLAEKFGLHTASGGQEARVGDLLAA